MRRGRDSNSRYDSTPYIRFPGVPLQPLEHLSKLGAQVSNFLRYTNNNFEIVNDKN